MASIFDGATLAYTITGEPVLRLIINASQLVDLYGASGLLMLIFGSGTAWHVQVETLGRLDDDSAMAFKSSVQNECGMVSVAVRHKKKNMSPAFYKPITHTQIIGSYCGSNIYDGAVS